MSIHFCIRNLTSLNRFKPSSKIFYWPFQGGTSFVDLLCFCSVLCLLCLCARLYICALWSPAGKGLTSWLSFVVSTVRLSLSHWYPVSGVVLDCIDSWSLHPYLLQRTDLLALSHMGSGSGVVLDCIDSWYSPSFTFKTLKTAMGQSLDVINA